MGEDPTYIKKESKSYRALRIISAVGTWGGITTELVGFFTNNVSLSQAGVYVSLPCFSYYLGSEAAESQFKRKRPYELEKKLE